MGVHIRNQNTSTYQAREAGCTIAWILLKFVRFACSMVPFGKVCYADGRPCCEGRFPARQNGIHSSPSSALLQRFVSNPAFCRESSMSAREISRAKPGHEEWSGNWFCRRCRESPHASNKYPEGVCRFGAPRVDYAS